MYSFSISEKLTLAQLLLQELNIDRIEIASAHVSEGESKAVKGITNWAKSNGYINRIEILTFVDNGRSINWMKKAGAKVQNLLTKGSLNHLKYQLKQTPKNHFKNILMCFLVFPGQTMHIQSELCKNIASRPGMCKTFKNISIWSCPNLPRPRSGKLRGK